MLQMLIKSTSLCCLLVYARYFSENISHIREPIFTGGVFLSNVQLSDGAGKKCIVKVKTNKTVEKKKCEE